MSSNTNSKLPPKENATFKKIVKCYEAKQFKPGLKYCRQILANPKFADHGETLAMKGLILNSTGRKEEADEHVKKGLKNDITSAVCWHVYGLILRSNRKYDEAMKCYRNALKWDKNNLQIYRDLSMVQLHLKDTEGFTDARYNILKLRPSQQSSWVGYSLAYYLVKDYIMALKILSEYRKTMIVAKSPPEYNEVVFFEAYMLTEQEKYEEALEHLIEQEINIVDVLCLAETRASIYIKLKRFSEAELIYRELLLRNSENYFYHQRLEECLGLVSDAAKLTHYQQMATEFPRSHVIRRMPLLLTTGDVFRGLMDKYLRSSLKKAIPSIYISIKVHYKNPEKVRIIEELVTGYMDVLRKCEKFDIDGLGPPEPPSTWLCTVVLLAQHHDAMKNSAMALKLINEAIDHTPTDVQLYILKAKIYRHGGDKAEAVQWMEEARTFDTADRFVNCKCVKYLFRTNRIEEGIDVAGMFTREGPSTLDIMHEMQGMWFQTELGFAYQRMGKLGEALKKFHEVDQHFADMIDDQFDFHGYCMRRVTLRQYLLLVHAEDKLRSHRYYVEVARSAIEIYLLLHDHPGAKRGIMNGPTTANSTELSSAELKKKQRKERKAQHRAQAQSKVQEENKPPQSNAEKAIADTQKSQFDPKQLLNAEKPLEEAIVFLKPLQSLSPSLMVSHLLAYAIHSRRRKFLLMLQSIKRAQEVDHENGELHSIIVDFVLAYDAAKQGLPGQVQEVVEANQHCLTEGRSLVELNREFLERHKDSLDHMIPASQVLYRLQPDSSRESAVGYITNLTDSMEGKTLKNCLKVQKLLQDNTFGLSNPAILKPYEEKCSTLFPLATAFRPSDSEATPSDAMGKVKAPKNITLVVGVGVLKETALSSAAMSDLSGDINVAPVLPKASIDDSIITGVD